MTQAPGRRSPGAAGVRFGRAGRPGRRKGSVRPPSPFLGGSPRWRALRPAAQRAREGPAPASCLQFPGSRTDAQFRRTIRSIAGRNSPNSLPAAFVDPVSLGVPRLCRAVYSRSVGASPHLASTAQPQASSLKASCADRRSAAPPHGSSSTGARPGSVAEATTRPNPVLPRRQPGGSHD